MPTAKLDLRPGDLVRVKSREEIEATLDRSNYNRGLASTARWSVTAVGRRASAPASAASSTSTPGG